ncbi:MAG: hypothetical protein V3U24_08425 [Candidatus Neomarinimicrobiota bacterium]
MIDWIIENKEWLFSGIGVLPVAVIMPKLITLIRKKLTQPESKADLEIQVPSLLSKTRAQDESYKAQDSQDESKPTILDRNELSPGRILEVLENTPPLQHQDIIKHYIGMPVDWDVAFFSARKQKDGMIRLTLSHPEIGGIISCSVRLSEYKEIAVMKKGAKLRVTGTIADISDPCFDLSDVKLHISR